MPQIILTDEQTRILTGADGPVDVCDSQGQPVASLRKLDPQDLEALERYRRTRGLKQPGVPSERVQALLQKMHEIVEREGSIDQTRVDELLRRTRTGEPL